VRTRKQWKTKLAQIFLFMTAVGLCSPQLSAQGVYGSIYGTVLDNSGAVVPKATVTIKSEQKDTTTSVQSNASGQYRIDHLVPDTYTVTITAAGFKTFAVNHLQVNVGEAPKVDANLEVGGETQTITVAAGVEDLLKTEKQDVSLSIPQETIQELPIVGQFVNNLILLSPGAYSALGQVGVQALNPDWVTVRVTLKTAPLKQWGVAREMRERIKARFDHEGISMQVPQRLFWQQGPGQQVPGQHAPAGAPE